MTKSKLVAGMDFKDLSMFNDSLLAKKTWRLLKKKSRFPLVETVQSKILPKLFDFRSEGF